MSGQASVQMRVDVGLRPGNINPHTFISVTHPDGNSFSISKKSKSPAGDLPPESVADFGTE